MVRHTTHRVVSEGSHVGVHSLMQLSCSNQCSCQVDIAINKLWLQSDSMVIIIQGLLQLTSFFEHIP